VLLGLGFTAAIHGEAALSLTAPLEVPVADASSKRPTSKKTNPLASDQEATTMPMKKTMAKHPKVTCPSVVEGLRIYTTLPI